MPGIASIPMRIGRYSWAQDFGENDGWLGDEGPIGLCVGRDSAAMTLAEPDR